MKLDTVEKAEKCLSVIRDALTAMDNIKGKNLAKYPHINLTADKIWVLSTIEERNYLAGELIQAANRIVYRKKDELKKLGVTLED